MPLAACAAYAAESCAAMRRLFCGSEVVSADMEDIFSRKADWEKFYGQAFLITGATGMLAAYFTLFLIWLNEEKDAGISVTVMIRDKEKCRKIFGEYCEKEYFHIFVTDLCHPDRPDGHFDYIIHAASLASGRHYRSNPVEVILPNCIGTDALLGMAVENNVKGFLYFSSGEVYGKMPDIPMEAVAEHVFGAVDPLMIHSCYDESKRIAETLCMAYAAEYGVRTKIVRLEHTYAPTMDIYNDPRAFASFVRCAVEKRDIELRSDGRSKRGFCYAVDAAAAFFIVLQWGKCGEAYNINNMSQFLSIYDIAVVVAGLEPENRLSVKRQPQAECGRIVEKTTVMDIPMDNRKALELGCEFRVGIKDGLGRCLRYFREKGL